MIYKLYVVKVEGVIELQDLELRNVTWDGVVSLRRRVIVKRADHEYSAQERSILFAAIAIGALVAIFPISAGIHRYGCRFVAC